MFRKISERAAASKAKMQVASDERKAIKAKKLLAGDLRRAAAGGDLDTVLRIIAECDGDLAVINHAKKGELLKTSDGVKFQAYHPGALHAAAYAGRLATLKALLEVEGVAVNTFAQGIHLRTPLLIAIVYGKKDCALELLKHPRVDVNVRTPLFNEYALLMAVGFLPAVIPALAARADLNPNVKGGADQTALHILCKKKYDQYDHCIEALLGHASIKVDLHDDQGYTPLMRAAVNGKSNVCQWLLDKGANKTLTNHTNCDAERLAALNGHEALASMIREYQPQEISHAERMDSFEGYVGCRPSLR